MDELDAMGYTLEWRQKVLQSAITGYMRILHKEECGGTPRNRKGADTLKTRRFKKLVGISEWFRLDKQKPDAWEVQEPWSHTGKQKQARRRPKHEEKYIESVMFLPYTPGSTLRNKVNRVEERLGFRTRFKFCEEMGRSVREMIVRKDPDPQECKRPNCMPC